MAARYAMADRKVMAWIESAPGPFEGSNIFDVWQQAFADYYGKDIGGFDVGWMFDLQRRSVPERCVCNQRL